MDRKDRDEAEALWRRLPQILVYILSPNAPGICKPTYKNDLARRVLSGFSLRITCRSNVLLMACGQGIDFALAFRHVLILFDTQDGAGCWAWKN